MSRTHLRSLLAIIGLATAVSVSPAHADVSTPHASVTAGDVEINVWVDGHCWRNSSGSGYEVNGYTQSHGFLYTSGGVVTGNSSASANSSGGDAASDNKVADGVLTMNALAQAWSSGTPQPFASNHNVGASVRPSSPFPGLPAYVGGSASFSCGTDSGVSINITYSCDMTYTLDPVGLRWYRSAGSAGSCIVIGG